MKKTVLYITFCLVNLICFSQSGFSKIEKEKYADADFYFYQERYYESFNILIQLYEHHKSHPELLFRLAVCELELGTHNPSTKRKLETAMTSGIQEAKFHLGRYYHLNHEFDLAINYFKDYTSFSRKEIDTEIVLKEINVCKQAKNLIAHPQDVLVFNLGEEVNSPFAEYVPVISADESELYFTSRRANSTGGKKDPNDKFFEDVYRIQKTASGWTTPENNLANINTKTHDATAAISTDGKSMVLYRTNRQLTGGDLYIANKVNDTWLEPKLLDANINSQFQEASACFSPDGQTLYFSSNRPGGYGGKDLYRVKKLPNGEWSFPKNLGPAVNTEFDEDSPFMDVDSRTLYFSSNGHETMGGFDIFTAKKTNKEEWSQPENLGYPANSVNDDIYLSLTPGGKKGYYSSEKEDGFGDQDLYEINFIYRQNINLVLKGELVDENRNPLKGEISIIEKESKELVGLFKSNAETGKFILILNPMVDYKVIVQADGKASLLDNYYFELPEDPSTEIYLDPIVLKN